VSEKFHHVNLWSCICPTDIELLAVSSPAVTWHGLYYHYVFITALVSEKFHRVNLWSCICLTDIELLAPFVFHHGRLKRLNSYIELRVTAMLTFCHQR